MQGRDHELHDAIDLAQCPVLRRLAPTGGQRIARRQRQAREPGLVILQWQRVGQPLAQQFIQGCRAVVTRQQALSGIDQIGLRRRGHLVSRAAQGRTQRGQAGGHVEVRRSDIPFAVRVIPEHQRESFVLRWQLTQANQPIQLVEQRFGLTGHEPRFPLLQCADHQRIAHAPAFRNAEKGRRRACLHATALSLPLLLATAAMSECLQHRHTELQELLLSRRTVLHVLEIHQCLQVGSGE